MQPLTSPSLAPAAPSSPAMDLPHSSAALDARRSSSTRTRSSFHQMASQDKGQHLSPFLLPWLARVDFGGNAAERSDPCEQPPAWPETLQADPKYRKYASSVDKTLQSFDQVNEWADFITFLAKLLKCFQAYPQFSVIPHKLIVAKRLSQCLNPALPTGVHQRALDVYTHILTTIGPENLRRDLPAWSSGLFPFFQYAATSVKPIVLNIYERFYLPLQESLRPATKAFILALLPGLEEETGEWFEKVAALLDRLSGTVSPSFFFQNLWLVLITAPTSRIPALNYLARRLPKMDDDESLQHIVGQDVGLMVRGLAAALDDPQILVQRGILDLLTSTLKLNSSGFKSTRTADQLLLFRAVINVVLRRDLSLSRRLYTWLLGPSDASDTQAEHLRLHGLDLLRQALKSEMDAVASGAVDERERQRPWKVFLSLLDKWEIGAGLTDVLVLDAFDALRRSLRPSDDHDELLMTGNMLFEVLDPFLLWKRIYATVKGELLDEEREDHQAIELARFVVRTFRLHDEEVQKLHAPITAFALLDLVESIASDTSKPLPSSSFAAALHLVLELLHEVPVRFFDSSPSSPSDAPPPSFGRTLADTLYGAEDMKSASLPETDGRELLAGGLGAVLRIMEASAERLTASAAAEEGEAGRRNGQDLLLAAVPVLEALVELASSNSPSDAADVSPRTAPPTEVALPLPLSSFDLPSWSTTLLRCLDAYPAKVAHFALHEAVIRSLLEVALARRKGGEGPGAGISAELGESGRRRLVETLAAKLIDYLSASTAPWYVEAVQLLWAVEALAPHKGYLESIIARRLADPNRETRLAGFEAFGTLWRFTEDAQLPGVVLKNPMFAVLDSLKSDDLSTRRSAEAWMRCSLKSYIRILDPLLFALLDPTISHRSKMDKVADVRLPLLEYQSAFDQQRVLHVLDNLLALARFGGQGFIRIAKGSFLKHTLDPALRERVLAADLETQAYLDGLVIVLLRFLRADPAPSLAPCDGPLNSHIHSVVAELLQVLISRGEAELAELASVETALVVRLFLSIHRQELDLQNKLLHVLHSVTFALSTAPRRHAPTLSTATSPDASTSSSALIQPPDLTREEMFVRVLSDAVSQNNNAVVHHWIDFLLMTVPQFRHQLHSVILPLIDRLVLRLDTLVKDLQASYTNLASPTASSSTTDAEYTALANALERLLLIAIAEAQAASADDELKSPTDRSASESAASTSSGGAGGLLGYVTGVLSQPEAESLDVPEGIKTKHDTLRRVRDVVGLLFFTWDVTSTLEHDVDDDRTSSRGHFAVRAKVRARRALERVYKAAPTDVLEDAVDYWFGQGKPAGRDSEDRFFSILQVLAPSPQTVISALCDKLNPKQASPKHKSPHTSSDAVIFTFLEAYIERLDGAMAVQVWAATLTFARDVLGTNALHRSLIFPTLRCFTTLAEKISQTSALEDRRLRRDLQETFIRLSDATIQLAGRAAESSNWLKKSAPEASSNGETASLASEKTKEDNGSTITETDKRAVPPERLFVREIAEFLAKRVLPDFRRFLVDADKTAAVCSNMVYYIVAPAFKTRAKTFDADPSVFSLLQEMTKNPQALKAWRSVVVDAFSDNCFFNASPAMHARWKPLIQAVADSDKERLAELTGKISTASSANIFTNRELESLSRALSLRRLTYTLFTGDKDRYLTQLPLIQEKLVDLLRSSVGDMVHAEVYLCLRVLFCRIGNQHLSGLWPVILTELLRLFDSLLEQPVADGSDLLQLVFSACKFLDLTLVLQTEDFQIHEWMFVTDTVDAIYPPDSWMPQAIMDRLGDILSDPARPPTTSSVLSIGPAAAGAGESEPTPAARRPLLSARRIGSISELEPFFATVSLAAYESIYNAGARVDWRAVEQSLENDLFEGSL
ncbi:hypothetical protein JCM8097_003757 [Rhodosporidiobolus ruineniae]